MDTFYWFLFFLWMGHTWFFACLIFFLLKTRHFGHYIVAALKMKFSPPLQVCCCCFCGCCFLWWNFSTIFVKSVLFVMCDHWSSCSTCLWPTSVLIVSLNVRKKKRKGNKQNKKKNYSTGLCRLAMCWNTLSMLSQAIYNSALAFIFHLPGPWSSARGESFGSSHDFSEHTSSFGHVNSFLNSPVYVGALKALITPCIHFFPQLCVVWCPSCWPSLPYPVLVPINAFNKCHMGCLSALKILLNREKQRLVLMPVLQGAKRQLHFKKQTHSLKIRSILLSLAIEACSKNVGCCHMATTDVASQRNARWTT